MPSWRLHSSSMPGLPPEGPARAEAVAADLQVSTSSPEAARRCRAPDGFSTGSGCCSLGHLCLFM